MPQDPSFWLDLFTGKTWREFLAAGAAVSGFRESQWSAVQRVRPGDYLLCYLTGVSRWIGVLEVTSGAFWDTSVIWEDDVFPCRVRAKIVAALTPETAVPVHDLRDQLSIFRGKKSGLHWTGYLRGSPRKWKESDGEAVLHALRKAVANPIVREVDPAKLERRPRSIRKELPETARLAQADLHKLLIGSLGNVVLSHTKIEDKPLDVDLSPPLPHHSRIYIYNATHPPGGRTVGEHKIQLIVPGQERGERGSFDYSDGRFVFLVGFEREVGIFVLWDAGLYNNFAYSRNVQVRAETIYHALAFGVATQNRALWGRAKETIVACKPEVLRDAVLLRTKLSTARILGG